MTKAQETERGAQATGMEEPMVVVRLPQAPEDDQGEGADIVHVQVGGVHRQLVRGEPAEIPASMYVTLKRTGRYDM